MRKFLMAFVVIGMVVLSACGFEINETPGNCKAEIIPPQLYITQVGSDKGFYAIQSVTDWTDLISGRSVLFDSLHPLQMSDSDYESRTLLI